MIALKGIYSIRDTPQPYYWDVVFEWEDELSRTLNLPILRVGKRYDKIYHPKLYRKLLNRMNFYQLLDKLFYRPAEFYLAFHIGPPGVYSFYSRRDVIPIIIDFWKYEDISRFESIFKLSKKVFVTSREVFSYLKKCSLGIRLDHLPLSLSDKLLKQSLSANRTIDIIQIGRQNKQITDYVWQFLQEFPHLNYVYAEKANERIQMISNKVGILGEFNKRFLFIDLLRKSRVSLLTAPGMDDDRARTGGFSPVTPRFFESAACRCFLLGIYPDNEDFKFNKIDEICHRIENYNSFRSALIGYLNTNELPDHSHILQFYLTSAIARELMNKLDNIDE